MKHKLTAFIVKNPPPADDNADSSAGMKKVDSADENTANGGDSAAVITNGNHSGGTGESNEDEETDWQPDDAVDQADRSVLTGRMGALVVHPDLELPAAERLDKFYAWLCEQKKADKLGNGKAIADEAHRLDVKDKASLLLVGTLCKAATITDDIKKHRDTLLRFTKGNQKAQKYLLGGVEQLIADKDNKAMLLTKTPIILKSLYDEDIVDEETLLEWGKKGPSKKHVSRDDSKAILAAAAPLLKWLQEAEEETDDEDEDDVAVDFADGDSRAVMTNGAGKTAASLANGVKPSNGHAVENGGSSSDDKDDLNIDDI